MKPLFTNIKLSLVAASVFLRVSQLPGLEPVLQHADINVRYHADVNDWSVTINLVNPSDAVERSLGVDEVFFPMIDAPSPGGDRFTRPSASQWDFLGIPAPPPALPLWILPQSNNNRTWPGFNSPQFGVFSSYGESDPRVGSAPAEWITIRVVSVDPPPGGDFSLWTNNSGQPPIVWAATAEGAWIEGMDLQPGSEGDAHFLFPGGNHEHLNWGFTRRGIYRVGIRPEAYFGPGQTGLVSASTNAELIFAVGTYATWTATHFDAAQLKDPLLSGPMADPDKDGLLNLIEFAGDGHPLVSDRTAFPATEVVTVGSDQHLALRYLRRGAVPEPGIDCTALFGDEPDALGTGGILVSEVDLPSGWKEVTIRDPQPINASRPRFGARSVKLLP